MLDVKATKLILSPNHYWLSTLWIYANETTFFPSKLQRVPTQCSYSSCRPISPRCSIRGMKMFLGQFFSKARCRVASSEEEDPSSSEESLGNGSGCLSADQPSSSFFTNFMWQPRIKIKNRLNHSTVVIALFLACSRQLNPRTPLFCFSFLFDTSIVSKSFSILQIILIKHTMSKEDTNNQPANPYLINTYGKTTSRLNKNWQTKQTPTASDTTDHKQIKDQAQKVQEKKDVYQNLMPRKVSELSPSVIFQDADGRQSNNIQPQSRRAQDSSHPGEEKPGQSAPLGLISNAFMGATTKYQKMDLQAKISTPNKNLEEGDYTPSYTKNQTASQASTNKLLRRREIRQSEPKIEALNFKDQAESASQTHTDRSNLEGKRIQRKQDRGKLLRTINKKDTSGSDRLSEHQGSAFANPGESKLTNETLSHIVEPNQPTDHFSTPATKVYKPIQRQNASRSRVVSETSTIQAPKRQVAQNVVINNSSINVQTTQSYTLEESQISTSKPQSIQRKPYNRSKAAEQQPSKLVNPTPIQPQQSQKSPPINPRTSLTLTQQPKMVQTKPESVGSNPKEEQPSPSSNKTTSPQKKSEALVTPDRSQAATERRSLRRSSVIGYILRRLLNSQMARTFQCFADYSRQDKLHKVNECSILMTSSQQIMKAKERNLMMVGFDQLRKKIIANCTQQSKQKVSKQQVNPVNVACHLLQIVLNSKIRNVFKCMGQNTAVINKLKSLVVVETFLKNKERIVYRSGLLQVQQKAKQRMCTLTHANAIMSSFYRQNKLNGFNSLKSYKLGGQVKPQPIKKQPTRSFIATKPLSSPQTQIQASSALLQKEQKLKALNSSIAQNLTILEADISNANKQRDQLTSQFQTKISILRQRNQQFMAQVTSKRSQNQKISKQLLRQPIKAPDDSIQEALQPETTKLDAITTIYISNYKNQQEMVRVQDIIPDLTLEADGRSIVREWELVFKNSDLKRIISSYQEGQSEVSKARQVVMEEQQMVLKLLRSYIKEQYFWQWLHTSVENL